jgi:hypothetical protein
MLLGGRVSKYNNVRPLINAGAAKRARGTRFAYIYIYIYIYMYTRSRERTQTISVGGYTLRRGVVYIGSTVRWVRDVYIIIIIIIIIMNV